MSLGEMTTKEQAVTVFGMLVLAPVGVLGGMEVLGAAGGAVGLVSAFAITWWGKVYCWKHTSYEQGLGSPTWVSDKD